MQTSKQQKDKKKRERERQRGFVIEKSLDKKKSFISYNFSLT